MKLRKQFTNWYCRKGYTFGYTGGKLVPVAVWDCPWWVKPFLFLFSPSTYYANENIGKAMMQGFLEGLSRGESEK